MPPQNWDARFGCNAVAVGQALRIGKKKKRCPTTGPRIRNNSKHNEYGRCWWSVDGTGEIALTVGHYLRSSWIARRTNNMAGLRRPVSRHVALLFDKVQVSLLFTIVDHGPTSRFYFTNITLLLKRRPPQNPAHAYGGYNSHIFRSTFMFRWTKNQFENSYLRLCVFSVFSRNRDKMIRLGWTRFLCFVA